ncbi:MAG: hypothetical protein HYU75_12690 [Betaproteobacteria bacterium]|nr:hypothetical protein [Betaproteobacteria bacterium]
MLARDGQPHHVFPARGYESPLQWIERDMQTGRLEKQVAERLGDAMEHYAGG